MKGFSHCRWNTVLGLVDTALTVHHNNEASHSAFDRYIIKPSIFYTGLTLRIDLIPIHMHSKCSFIEHVCTFSDGEAQR